MAIIDIEQVQLAPVPVAIRNFAIDRPTMGAGLGVYDIQFAGWAMGDPSRPREIALYSGDELIRRARFDQPRPDVGERYPEADAAAISGFNTFVNVVGLEPGAPLSLRLLEDGEPRQLATVTYRHQPLVSAYTPRLQPLMLTTLGRAGTTWTMRLLSEHPGIAIHRAHPYELRIARHWLHSFKILTEPRDLEHSAHADTFHHSTSWAGHNPFYPIPLGVTPGLREWYGKTYVEEYAATVQRWIDECYDRIAAGQGTSDPVYFAEKHRADGLPWVVWELYPRAKEVFLVRDFRDVISSMLAFNTKHGRQVFGPKQPISDEEFVHFVRNGPIRLVSTSWQKRHDRAILIRYEDLIQEPAATVRAILTYLELDAAPMTIDHMLERAAAENPDMSRHRTSSAVSSSLGRWRSSLSPSVQSVCDEVLGDVLRQFGYEV
ncbi:MAG: sulfotransferase [Chloroflexota bacterium]|nr:sulfotransferase [Chloroflexota bacterium]